MLHRTRYARTDDTVRKFVVGRARTRLIYEKGKGVSSKLVESLLKPTSLVLTTVRVSGSDTLASKILTNLLTECFLRSSRRVPS